MKLCCGKAEVLWVFVEEVVGGGVEEVRGRWREPLYLAMIRKRTALACWRLELNLSENCEQKFT